MAKFVVRCRQDNNSVMDFYVGCYDKVKATDFPKSITSFTSDAFKEEKKNGQVMNYIRELDLPSSISNIPSNAFKDCENLETIIIPDSVQSIEKNAFKNCTNLKRVVLSSNIVELPSGLFSGCARLTKIVVRNTSSLLKIAKDAFSGCNLNVLRFEIAEGDNTISSQSALNIRNQYFEAVKEKINAGFLKRIFSNTNCDIETKLLNGFDKLLVSKLRDLDPIRKGIVQIFGLNDYKKMPNVDYNGILTLSSEEDLPTDLFLGQSIVGTWYWHKKRNQFVPYTVDIEEKLLVEKYKDFVTFLFSQGANYVEFSINGTKVESITKDEIVKSSINAKTSDDVPGNVDSKNGVDLSDTAKSFEKTLKKEVLKSAAIPKVSNELPKLLWYSEGELKELKKQFENKKTWDYSITLSNELRQDTTQKKTIDSSLDSIYGALGVKYDKSNTGKLEFNYDQEIKLYATFGSETPNPSSPEPKSDDSDEKKKNELPESQGASKPLKYSDWGKNLFERPDDTKELLDVVNNNKFVNLVAMGGSGKTSLVKLFMAEYETSFDRIEYSLINNKLSSDIFSNNSTLKEFFDNDKILKEIKDSEDKFANAINVLQNFETENNLWIIDINETSDYKEIENIIDAWISQSNQIVNPWKNWRFLFVGRKCFHSIETNLFVPYDLKNTHDVLKGIFFKYLDNRTENYQQRVSDGKINIDELFSGLFDLPILVEHTARFLSKWPVVCETTDAIFKIIDPKGGNKRASVKFLKELKAQGSAFWNKNQDFTKAPQYKNVADFLTYLLFFDDLKEDQKYVCRYFMLWPAEPLTLKEVHRMIGDDEDYSEFKLGLCLMSLEEERIIVGDNRDGEKAYKMHALTADAFRVQVLKDKKVDERYRDYSQYLANIEKLKDTSSEIENCLSFCFAQTKKTSETYLPAEFFDNDEGLFKADFYKKLADLTKNTPLYEKWYKLKLIEEVCGITDHKQKWDKYQKYKDKSSHKVYEDYVKEHSDEFSNDIKSLDFGDEVLNELSSMIKIEGGEFDMGGEKSDDEKPKHSVKLDGFYIGKYPVTQELWEKVMGSLPEDDDYKDERFRGGRKPVIDVSWYDCMDFIIALNKQTGLQFRLPTEAEWEYACRCSGVDKYKLDDVAWYYDNSGRQLHEVGTTKKSSELAIQDMLGNVWEWCSDWAGSCSDEPQVDPQGPSMGSSRVNRGGGWFNDDGCCRVAYRNDGNPCYRVRDYHVGFRLAVSLQFKK